MNRNTHSNIGKVIFIFILSCWIGYHLYSNSMDEYNQNSNLTLDEYIENYEQYKEKLTDQPPSLVVYFLILFVSWVIVFVIYEFSGRLSAWASSYIQNRTFQKENRKSAKTMNSTLISNRPLKEKVDNELEPGERIRWIEQPKPRFFSPASTGAFLFAIPWTAFSIFWMYGASQSPSNGFSLFGVPFVLIGIGMLSSPLWVYYQTFRTVYLITDRRAITIDGGRSYTIRSYPPDKLQNIYRRERKNGIGDIIISFDPWKDSDGDTHKKDLGFLNIREPKHVEKILKELATIVLSKK